MRTLFFTAALLALAFTAYAADVKLQWDANTETDLAGYRLYQKRDSAVSPELLEDVAKSHAAGRK